jgi:hypothetical protein
MVSVDPRHVCARGSRAALPRTPSQSGDKSKEGGRAMTCVCQICHRLIDSDFVPSNPADASNAIREYDSLAARMMMHIVDCHPFQVDEMIRVKTHAAKMYAMNWATFDPLAGQTLEVLRREWRAQLLMVMATTTLIQNQPAAPAPAGGADSPASKTPSGSN